MVSWAQAVLTRAATPAVWAVLAVVVAVPLDALHVRLGVIVPAQPGFDEKAIPLFAVGGVVLGALHRRVALPLGALWAARRNVPTASARAAAVASAAFVASYVSSVFLWPWPAVALALDVALWGVLVLGTVAAARPALCLFSGAVGLGGPAFESLLSSWGVFAYAVPHAAGVPVWLVGIYLNAAAAIHVVDRWLLGVGSRSGDRAVDVVIAPADAPGWNPS